MSRELRPKRSARQAMETLEARRLLSFDPGLVGVVRARDPAVEALGGGSFFSENQRIGYMLTTGNGLYPATGRGEGGEP